MPPPLNCLSPLLRPDARPSSALTRAPSSELSLAPVSAAVFYYHYTPDFHTALQYSYPNAPDYYRELDKCTIGPSWCAFNSVTNMTKPSWHPADYRQYNFPHQITVYLSLYRAARELDRAAATTGAALLSEHYSWYLDRAARTLLALGCCSADGGKFSCRCFPTVGLMDGTIFREVLLALWAEAEAAEEEAKAAAKAELAKAKAATATAAEAATTASSPGDQSSAAMPDWRGYASLIDYMLRLRVFGPENAGRQPGEGAEDRAGPTTKGARVATEKKKGAKGANGGEGAEGRPRVPWVEQDAPYGSEFK